MQTDDSTSFDVVDEKAVIMLKSETGVTVSVNRQAAMMSRLIQTSLENGRGGGGLHLLLLIFRSAC